MKILPEPVFGDKTDFTGKWQINNISKAPSQANTEDEDIKSELNQDQDKDEQEKESQPHCWYKVRQIGSYMLDYTYFKLFPYVLVAVIFLSVIKFDGTSFADLIDICFLLQCFYLLAYIKSLYAKNVQMLAFLRRYNIVVLAILAAYQAPIFPCPNAKESTGDYIPAAECLPERVQRGQGLMSIPSWHTFYVVLSQSLGLKKYTEASQFPWTYLLILLFTELQEAAFHHPYFGAYTLQEMRNQKLDARMRAFMTVENYHLGRKWAYQAIKQ